MPLNGIRATPDKNILRRWAEELESGKYSQTTGRLTEVHANGAFSHCCLGVLSEMAVSAGLGIERLTGEEYDENGDVEKMYASYDGERGFPPEKVREWAGLMFSNALLNIPPDIAERIYADMDPVEREAALADPEESASTLNDEHKLSFADIAKCIRYTFGV